MDDLKEFLSVLTFWIKEKITLRKYQGVSKPNNIGNRKRNDIFYKKIESELMSILEKNGFKKQKKRIFVLDTNVLMHDPTALFRFQEHDIFIPMVVLEELDAPQTIAVVSLINGSSCTIIRGRNKGRGA